MSYNRGYAKSASVKRAYPVSASSGSSYHSRPKHPFGPGMAEDVFSVYDEDDYAMDECIDDYHPTIEELDPENLFNGEYQSFHFRHQDELDLETNEEREARLKNSIRKFESAYRRMCIYALKWHYLQEEVEENVQIKKMFKDMQMFRKLNGSDRV